MIFSTYFREKIKIKARTLGFVSKNVMEMSPNREGSFQIICKNQKKC